MNVTDTQQTQTAKPVTTWNGKPLPAEGVGNFASLLQYLVQPSTEAAQSVSSNQPTIPADTPEMSDLKPLLNQLTMQPEKVLQLLEQPEIEHIKEDPKKMMELLQFIKTVQDGQPEQAQVLFQQLPVPVQQTVMTVLTALVGETKADALPAPTAKAPVVPTIRTPFMSGTFIKNPPAVTKDGQPVQIIAAEGEGIVEQKTNPVPVIPKAENPVDLPESAVSRKAIAFPKWNQEALNMMKDPEGKELPLPLTGIKLDRAAGAAQATPLPASSNVDEQLASRIEAALKQAPFLKGADGSTRMSIRLYPEQLGEVVVQLDKKDGILTVKLFAATEQAKQLMDQQLGKLHTSLQPQAPLVKVETGMLASTVKDFEQGQPQERRDRQQEEPVPYEDEPEEDEDDGVY